MTCADAALSAADKILGDLGGDIVYLDRAGTRPDNITHAVPVLVVVVDDDIFKCKHIRLNPAIGGKQNTTLMIPRKIHQYLTSKGVQTVYIKRASCNNARNLRAPLTNMHYRDLKTGEWNGPRPRSSRLARIVERMRERRDKYALN